MTGGSKINRIIHGAIIRSLKNRAIALVEMHKASRCLKPPRLVGTMTISAENFGQRVAQNDDINRFGQIACNQFPVTQTNSIRSVFVVA